METPQFLPLTPEQIAAVQAGGGFACCEDPATHTVYHLIQQDEPPTLDDDYFREKLAEADADIAKNGLQPLNMEAIKAEFERRLLARQNLQR
jgi:hypothetical protein